MTKYCVYIAGQGTSKYATAEEREEKLTEVYGDGTYVGFLCVGTNPYNTWEEE